MTLPSIPSRIGLPLAMQLIAILVCVLLAAQLVTLALTVVLPPAPAERWNMDELVAALSNQRIPDRLERKWMSGPPDVAGQGWLVSQSSREALARRLGRDTQDVVLAFYTELPVGGVAVPSAGRQPLALAQMRVHSPSGSGPLSSLLIETAHAQAIPGGPPPGGSPGPGGMPGGGFPGGRLPGGFPGGSFPRMPGGATPGGGRAIGGGRIPGSSAAERAANARSTDTATSERNGAAVHASAAQSGSSPAGGAGERPSTPGPSASAPIAIQNPQPIGGIAISPLLTNEPAGGVLPATRAAEAPSPAAARMASASAAPVRAAAVAPAAAPLAASEQATLSPGADAAPGATEITEVHGTPQPIPFRRDRMSLFTLASPPFIQGDFVAAVRQSDGRWVAVAPRAEPFPNAWQKRVMLWFALSLAIVSPLAWLFAHRIVVPLRDFARAAEQLGRDPSATILPLSGPAEIGRAANAFNQMRNRLRAFVDDRTAMVGAISHDLRTPLTRLRFRIEDVPDDQRDGLLREVTEMEAMISQVIAFIRDASTPGARERVDFADLVAGSVADARLVGGNVEIERNAHIPVEVDPMGMRRLLGNLLENAVKYGESARVRVSLREGEAVAEIVDAGPGIPEDEFDRAFEPFYRSEAARQSGRTGSGLGLAVCRSIARAHGGDVSFVHGGDGFVARVTLPAAFQTTLRKAA